ncbi:MAG: capsid protein [Pseudomonadota bacterium]|nr:capsid protein [Pseudomonadota bacterium]
MSNANPSYLGQQNFAGDTSALFLKVFAGEVLAAFQKAVVALDRTRSRMITAGKSATFPATGRQAAYYHVPGTEIVGNPIAQSEQVVTIDQLLVSPVFIADIDDAMNYYDVRSIYSNECGLALAYQLDANILQTGLLAARASTAVTGLPGGASLINANYKTDSTSLAGGLFYAAQILDENAVPAEGRTAYLRPAQYYLLAQNTTAINTLYGGSGAYSEGKVTSIAGIELVKALQLPTTNIATGPAKYQVNGANTAALIMGQDAVGTVKLMDVSMQHQYDVRRQGTLMLGRYAVGHGVLRPDAAVELKTA